MTGTEHQRPRVVVDNLLFPEGPRWHGDRFWFSDIHAHRVYSLTVDGHLETVAELDDRPSGLGFLPSGDLLVVSMLDRRLLRIRSDGGTDVHADLSDLCGQFINDMVVDARGRAYVGSRNGGAPGTDSVILVHPDGRINVALPEVTSPNGTVITADGRSLILAQTHICRLTQFEVASDGTLSSPMLFAEIDGVHFDGICLDADGMIWSGGGGGLVRVASGGQIVRDVAINVAPYHVVACVLGGADRRTMVLALAHLTPDTFVHVGSDRTKDSTTDARGLIAMLDLDVAGSGWP